MESWNRTNADAVRTHTPDSLNCRIDMKVEDCVRHMAEQDRGAHTHYLEKLEREWDLHRALLVGTSALAFASALLSRRLGRGWLTACAVASALALQHGLMGFGPAASALRLLGVRTRREIDLEKFAVKALRGDFERIPRVDGGPLARANAALVAAQS